MLEYEATIENLSRPLEPLPTSIQPRLNPLANVRAVLFDIYGTLLISGSGEVGSAAAQDDASAFTDSIRAMGIGFRDESIGERAVQKLAREVQQRQEHRRREGIPFPEVDMRQVWRVTLEELRETDQIDVEAIDDELIAHFGLEYECRVNPVWPMPGTRSTLLELQSHGLPMGIVSNAQYYTPLLLKVLLPGFPDKLGFEESLITWSYEILESKPSPRIFAKPLENLRERYGIGPSETVYVGNDMLNDVWTASQLGLRTILFAGDQRSLQLHANDQRCGTIQPDATIDSLDQIPPTLGITHEPGFRS